MHRFCLYFLAPGLRVGALFRLSLTKRCYLLTDEHAIRFLLTCLLFHLPFKLQQPLAISSFNLLPLGSLLLC